MAVVERQAPRDQRAGVGLDLPLPEDQLGPRRLEIALVERQPAVAPAQGDIADLDIAIDEPEAEAVPALAPVDKAQSDAFGEVQFDRMTEEDLLRGLEGLVPPAETEDDSD